MPLSGLWGHSHTHLHSHTCAPTHTHVFSHMCIHTHMHSHVHSHTCTYTHIYSHVYSTHMHSHTCALNTHALTHVHIHTDTPLYAYFYKKKSLWLSQMIKVILNESKNAEIIEVLNTRIKVLQNSFFWKERQILKQILKPKKNYLVLCGVTWSLSHWIYNEHLSLYVCVHACVCVHERLCGGQRLTWDVFL